MSHQDRRDFLLAEKEDLTERIQHPTNPFAQASLGPRLAQVESELIALGQVAENPVRLARTKLTFRGKPVFGQRGVQADFGLEAAEGFQRAIHRRGAALAKANSRGMLPPPPHMAIVDVARGSFGFVLEEVQPEGGILQGPSHMAQAIQEIQEVVDLARTGSEKEFIDKMKTLDGGTAQALRDFLETVDLAGATFRVWTSEKDAYLDEKEIAAASHWVQRTNLAEDETDLLGNLAGLFMLSRKFEFQPEGRKVIHGQLDLGLDTHELASWIEKRCLATFRAERKRKAGSKKAGQPKWVLVRVGEPPGPSHAPLISSVIEDEIPEPGPSETLSEMPNMTIGMKPPQ
jgi:hypothetical protein